MRTVSFTLESDCENAETGIASVAPTKLLSGIATGPVAGKVAVAPAPPVGRSNDRLNGPLGVARLSTRWMGLPTWRGSALLDSRNGSALAAVPPEPGMTG